MQMRMVTFTGGDESCVADELFALWENRPWLELGFLVSGGTSARPRYAGRDFLRLVGEQPAEFRRSLHVCSKVLDGLLAGRMSASEREWYQEHLATVRPQRVQLNWTGRTGHLDPAAFVDAAAELFGDRQVILQANNLTRRACEQVQALSDRVAFLADASGGRGVLPTNWSLPPVGHYIGFAGGLNPENLQDALVAMGRVVPARQRVWVDLESGVRDPDNPAIFSVPRAKSALAAVAAYLKSPSGC